jgi:hypothetical protein
MRIEEKQQMSLTQKRKEELYDQLAQRQGQRVREMIEPKSIAERMYPKLKTDDERRLQEKTNERKR